MAAQPHAPAADAAKAPAEQTAAAKAPAPTTPGPQPDDQPTPPAKKQRTVRYVPDAHGGSTAVFEDA